MPLFGANGLLRWIKIQKRKPLNRCSLMNARLDSFYFSTATFTDPRRRGQGPQARFRITFAWATIGPVRSLNFERAMIRHLLPAILIENAFRKPVYLTRNSLLPPPTSTYRPWVFPGRLASY